MIGSQFKLVSVICRIICNFYFRWLYDCIASIRVYTIYGIACTYISYRHCCCLHDAVLVPPIVALPQRGAFDLNWVVARSHNYANCVDAADKESNRIESNRIESKWTYIYVFACMQCAEGVSAIFGGSVGPWQEAEVLNLDCFMQRQRATPRLRMGGRLQNVQLTWHLSVDCFMFLVLL